MTKRPKHLLWLIQAESDLRGVASLIDAAHYDLACFMAQQGAEKGLKALAFFRGRDQIKSHALGQIARDLEINGVLAKAAFKLDLYYISARYPDALPEGSVPAEEFTRDAAEEALQMAQSFVDRAKSEIQS